MKYLSFFAVPAFLLAGCAASTGDDANAPGSDSDAVVGVTDLTAMEAELGLTKDTKDAHGNWSRGDALLKGGSCYKQTVGKLGAANWEFRRYKNGAAFFHKVGTAPETNDYRPVTCVDVDVKEDGATSTRALSGTLLDAALRYNLGSGWTDDGATGHEYKSFARGAVEFADASRYCGFRFSPGNTATSDPALLTGNAAYASCIASTHDANACYTKGEAACEASAKADIAANTLARPANAGAYLYEVLVKGANGNYSYVSPSIAELAYRFAWKSAQNKDVFTEAGDPVGTFQKFEQSATTPAIGAPGGVVLPPAATEHARYSKVDVHRVITPQPQGAYLEQLYVTPKNSDANLAAHALAECFRAVIPNTPSSDFVCSGI